MIKQNWNIEDDEDTIFIYPGDEDGREEYVATIDKRWDRPAEERNRFARLIACAPDMLYKLKEVSNLLTDIGAHLNVVREIDELVESIERRKT